MSGNNNISPVEEIIEHYLRNHCNQEAADKVQRWLLEDDKAEEKQNALWEAFQSLNLQPDNETLVSYEEVVRRANIHRKKPKKSLLNHYAFRIAAAIIPAIIIAAAYYLISNPEAEAIQPEVHYTEVIVPHGQHKQLVLADGTRVRINAGSRFKYPDKFTGDERRVELEGEAYFDVRKDKSHPFRIHTKHIEVVVLGTVFNVNSYPERTTAEVALESGKVLVETDKQQILELSPGEQVVYEKKTSHAVINKVNNKDHLEWTTGALYFTDATMEEILRALERQHDIRFVYDENALTDDLYTIRFEKEEEFSDRLKSIEFMLRNTVCTVNGKEIKITIDE